MGVGNSNQPQHHQRGICRHGETIKAARQQGQTVEEIFREKLGRFPRFEFLLQAVPAITPSVTSFICRMYGRVAGPNWLIAGEPAAMVDPMTANGVTAALRHASEASHLLIKSRHRKSIPWLAAAMYSPRILDWRMFFNRGIERVIYESPIRNHIGVLKAGDVYTVPAWSLNAIYSRLRPRGVLKTLLFGRLLNLSRTGTFLFYRFCKWQQPSRFPQPRCLCLFPEAAYPRAAARPSPPRVEINPTPGWLTTGVDSLMLAPPMFVNPTEILSLTLECPGSGTALRSLTRIVHKRYAVQVRVVFKAKSST